MAIEITDVGSHLDFQNTAGTKVDHVPAGVYILKDPPMAPTRLVRNRKQFAAPEQVFGDHSKNLERLMRDYDPTNPAVGALLTGLKGTGKSLLAEALGNRFVAKGMPVIMIEDAFPIGVLRPIIKASAPCMVYFDEFEKVYDEDDQQKILSLFSDSSMNGVMFVVAINAIDNLSEYLLNRPGRFRFRIKFNAMSVKLGKEIARSFHLSEEFVELAGFYALKNAVSVDIMKTFCQVARSCSSVQEFSEEVQFINIPEPDYPYPCLRDLRLNGQDLLQDDVEVDGDIHAVHVKTRFTDRENVEFTFNPTDSRRRALDNNLKDQSGVNKFEAGYGLWSLELEGGIVLRYDVDTTIYFNHAKAKSNLFPRDFLLEHAKKAEEEEIVPVQEAKTRPEEKPLVEMPNMAQAIIQGSPEMVKRAVKVMQDMVAIKFNDTLDGADQAVA